ncbi:MAG: CbiX/SirB N-terminal domain-containing protein [Nannocystis sp.]|nr:CbiX/SirB N-terminal domain-containing protein [Nannocystis sp.]
MLIPEVPERSQADAIVLLAHGSPDPDWMLPIERCAALIRTQARGCPVYVATLEQGRSLGSVVEELVAAGHREVAVIPFFLSPGGKHIKRDLPALVAATQAAFPGLQLRLSPGAIGVDPDVLAALATAALRRAGFDDLS